MKTNIIAIACVKFPLPSETFILSQAVLLKKLGYEVHIFPYMKSEWNAKELKEYELEEHVYPAIVPSRNYTIRLINATKLWWRFRRYSLRLLKTLNFFVLGKDGLNLSVFYSSLIWLNRPAYKVVIANFGEVGVALSKLIKCGFLDGPLIAWFHGYDMSNTRILSEMANPYRRLFKVSSAAVGVSKAMCRRMENLGCPSEKLIYIPYAPRTDFFSIDVNYSSPTFLAVGRLVPKKAPHLLLLAFKQVTIRFPQASLIIVGDGPLRLYCESLIISEHIPNVLMRRTLHHLDTMRCFEEAFCFVQHSIVAPNGDREGTPVSILEAGAAALPVVSTRHEGIAEVVLEEETGILVDEGDINGMATAMLRLFSDRLLARSMGERARRHIENHFNHVNYSRKLDTLVKEIHAKHA